MYRIYTKLLGVLKKHVHKFLFIMRLTTFILIATMLQVSAASLAQKITYVHKDVTPVQLFKVIKSQTGYNVVWYEGNLDAGKTINANFKDTPLEEVMDQVLKGQPLSYSIEKQTIVIKEKKPSILENIISHFATIDIRGKIIDENGDAIPGVTITVKGTDKVTIANSNGEFTLTGVDEKAELVITSVGYKTLILKAKSDINIKLEAKISALDQVQIIGYGTTTKRLNTGDVGSIKAEDITKQPISNPLSALEGRVPGLVITQSSGVVGSALKVQLRGQGSLLQGTDPLFIIDGVPFSPGNSPLNSVANAAGSGGSSGISPLYTINPADIESIDVLKDADATSIYGSRGANGVILITTKKGQVGKTKLTANAYTGFSRITRTMDMLNTEQYIEMRKEAFENDGVTPTNDNAPDLLLWANTCRTSKRSC